MKKNYFFLLIFLFALKINSQTNCLDAQADLNYAYSHVKSSYDSNNHSHLKYYAKRSYDAFVRANELLKDCDCNEAYQYGYEAQKMLHKLPESSSFEDGRFYVKRAKETAQKAFIAYENCTKLATEDEALAKLEYEQQKLQEQQERLKQKEEELKRILVEKKQKELQLKKEKLITESELALNKTIDALNSMLDACECNSRVLTKPLLEGSMDDKSIEDIKLIYINTIKKMTSDYLTQLNQCEI